MAQSIPSTAEEPAAVVMIGDCTNPATAELASAFRTGLRSTGVSVLSEADTAAPVGGLSRRSPAELREALDQARDEFINGQVASARESLERLALEVGRLEPSPERWELQRSVLTSLAQVAARSDEGAARSILRGILAVEPDYRPDPSTFPPSFLARVNTLREELRRTATNSLVVQTEPRELGIVVDGRPMGLAPVALQLPPGVYRIEGMWGYRGLSTTVEVAPPPQPAAHVEISLAKQGWIAPDRGPCVSPVPDREAALGRLAQLIKVKRIYALRSETAGTERRLLAEEFDVSTRRDVRAGRETLVSGDPGTQAAARLALTLAIPAAPAAAAPGRPSQVVNGGLRTWSYVAGGIGLAAIGVGLAVYFSGNSQLKKLESKYAEGNNSFPPSYESTFRSQTSNATTLKTAGAVVTAMGVAALATGVALFFISASGGEPNPVTLGPSPQAGGGGVMICGRF